MEKSYIWTDENTFNEVLLDVPKNSFNTEFLRKILREYFNCIKNIINHNIPKIIMLLFIRSVQKNIQIFLLNKLQSQEYITLLNEDPEIQLKRTKLKNIISILNDSRDKLTQLN